MGTASTRKATGRCVCCASWTDTVHGFEGTPRMVLVLLDIIGAQPGASSELFDMTDQVPARTRECTVVTPLCAGCAGKWDLTPALAIAETLPIVRAVLDDEDA